MRNWEWGIVCLWLSGLSGLAHAAELKDCLKLKTEASGSAILSNVCTERLNIIYCVDNARSAKSCARESLGVTTLLPGTADTLPSYTADGAGAVYWAVCVYPEAPIQWKPGPESPYACKKTCVMC